jgi:hypothetical protein
MLRIVCFAEAPADARLVRELCDRVLVEEGPDWVESGLDALRVWTGLDSARDFTKWTDLKHSTSRPGRPRYIGHSTTGPREPTTPWPSRP